MVITTWEASQKYGFTTRHLRYLLEQNTIKGRLAGISSNKGMWLVDESSLQKYLKKERKPGPKPKTK